MPTVAPGASHVNTSPAIQDWTFTGAQPAQGYRLEIYDFSGVTFIVAYNIAPGGSTVQSSIDTSSAGYLCRCYITQNGAKGPATIHMIP